MRFPSLSHLAFEARCTLLRFPWTLAAGAVAATCAIVASQNPEAEEWIRAAFVAALALPLTLALTLVAEGKLWAPVVRTGSLAAGVLLLLLFLRDWGGIEHQPDTFRYLQLSAALHLTVAFLPFLGQARRMAFWQYNRRLFLGFLRAVVFSTVIFIAVAIALGALDKLFGVDVDGKAYLHIWFVVAFVVNTWLFLATVPDDLPALEQDADYPKALKVFAQYILTPIAFGYLIILLAYLVKLVSGAEWPNGWIGWLVASVAVSGILGFLLIEPLRGRAGEGWIRIYSRWLFLGLIPAALMLLAAFWKRIEPYGLTEPRTLGLLLGLWLLGVAILFSLRPGASIKIIPVSLAVLLLATLYGPASLAALSVASQGRRFERMIHAGNDATSAAEASATLRFLLDHRASTEIASRIGKPLPAIEWDSVSRSGPERDTVATQLLALAGVTYRSQPLRADPDQFSLERAEATAFAVDGVRWVVPMRFGDTAGRAVGGDTVRLLSAAMDARQRIAVGRDTLEFDLAALIYRDGDSVAAVRSADGVARIASRSGARHADLLLQNLNGLLNESGVRISYWSGNLLLR
ncbi:MAG: DUF4153 domain-containing protein [Gemmatimonadota bacterium]